MQDGYIILRKIIKNRGMEILNDRKVLSGLIEDLMPTNIREKTSLQLAVSSGVAEMFHDFCSLSRPGMNARVSSVNSYITEELGLTQSRASYIINAFMYGVGMDAVSVDPYETIDYRELAEKYENEGHKDIALLLYEIVRNAGDEDTKYSSGMALLKSDIKDAKKKGIEILKTLTCKKEAMYAVGMEYLENILKERGAVNRGPAGKDLFGEDLSGWSFYDEDDPEGDHSVRGLSEGSIGIPDDLRGDHPAGGLSEGSLMDRGRSESADEAAHKDSLKNAADYFAKALPYPPAMLELGKLYFYGWGVKADLHKAIRLFEQYLKAKEKGHADSKEEDITAIMNATPFLIQCYYEDILQTRSFRSLEKLAELADYRGWRMAQKYLVSYYSDTESDHANEFLASKYKKKLSKNRENPYLVLGRIRGGMNSLLMNLRVTGALYGFSDGKHLQCAMALRDHLLLGEELNESGFEDNAALCYLLMGEMLFTTGVMQKNLLRAEIYIKNYLDRVSGEKDKKNYSRALIIYSRLLLDHKLGPGRWNSADECIKLAERLTGESIREEIMEDMLKKVRFFGHRGDMGKAVAYLEKAVEYGYQDDYSIIGTVYLNGDEGIERDEKKGFYWLKKFYDDYMMERLKLTDSVDIGAIEYRLYECYKTGTGVEKNDEDAMLYYERALDHGNMEARELV
ncbi:MAG: hypothetical protein K5886_12255, partial [Lachnospiraceae bacterium]|nr:hypothetical protein [Lachnospiraceae bacterium]